MKLKSLILGTVAAAGLSTGAFAADLGVLTSLDVCDSLGISGLTISSDTNCLQISGGVSYEFNWGDYRHARGAADAPAGYVDPVAGYSGSDLIVGGTPFGNATTMGSSDDIPGIGDFATDYDSKIEAWLKFVGTADSDFGPAKAVIKLKSVDQTRYINQGEDGTGVGADVGGAILGADDQVFDIDEAYVSIGDSTVIMAGKKSSIANFGDSEPFNFTKLFAWDVVDDGVGFDADGDRVNFTGEHVIQVVSDLGNGLNVGVGLENLNGKDADGVLTAAHGAGTLVGVLNYAGEGITAHITGLAIGVLDGQVDAWGVHAGATGTFDNFRVRAAVGYLGKDYTDIGGDESSTLHAMLTGEATFDMFTVALSGEYARAENVTAGTEVDGFGLGGSVGFAVTDGVKINLGARYFNNNPVAGGDDDTLQVAAQLVAAVTETIKVTGEVGAYWNDDLITGSDSPVVYGAAELAWTPGGGFTSSVKGQANSDGAYRLTYKAAKTFE